MKFKLFVLIIIVSLTSYAGFAGRIIGERHLTMPFLSLHKQEKLPDNEIIIMEAYLEKFALNPANLLERFDILSVKVKVKNFHWEKIFTVGSTFYPHVFEINNYITENIYFKSLKNCISYEGKTPDGNDIFEMLVRFPVAKYYDGTREFTIKLLMNGQNYVNKFTVGHEHF